MSGHDGGDDSSTDERGISSSSSAAPRLIEVGKSLPHLEKPVAAVQLKDENGKLVNTYEAGFGWAPQAGSSFDVRVGPDYAKRKRKAASGPALYECISVDMFGFDLRPDYIADTLKLPPLSPELAELEDRLTVPVNIIVNLQFPRKITTSLFSKRNDGEGCLFIIVFRIKVSTARLCTMDEAEDSAGEITNAIRLLKKTFENADEDPGHNLFGTFKQIGRIVNIEEIDVPGILTPLLKFNGKPRLLRTIKFRRLGKHSVEILSGTFDCNYILRSAVINYKDTMGHFILDMAWCLEGEGDDEQPEQILGCFQMVRAEFRHAKPFPFAGTRIDMAEDYIEHSYAASDAKPGAGEPSDSTKVGGGSGSDYDFKSGNEMDQQTRLERRAAAAAAANARIGPSGEVVELEHALGGVPSDSDESDEYDSDGNPIPRAVNSSRDLQAQTAGTSGGQSRGGVQSDRRNVGAESQGLTVEPASSPFNIADNNLQIFFGDEIELITQTAFKEAFSKKVGSSPAHPPGPVGYYDKDGRHGVLAVVPPVGGRAESQFHSSKFTVLRPDGSTCDYLLGESDAEDNNAGDGSSSHLESVRIPLVYGAPFILVDQNGLVWNNRVSTSIKYNYIGPRRRFTRGEMVLKFAASGARSDSDAVRCGDRLCIDVMDSNRTQQKYNERLTNSKRAASSLIGGYICSCGEGRVLVFQPRLLRRRAVVRVARRPSVDVHITASSAAELLHSRQSHAELNSSIHDPQSSTRNSTATSGAASTSDSRRVVSLTTSGLEDDVLSILKSERGSRRSHNSNRSRGQSGEIVDGSANDSLGSQSTGVRTAARGPGRAGGQSDSRAAVIASATRGSALDAAITHNNIDMKIIVAITCIAIAASLAPLLASRGMKGVQDFFTGGAGSESADDDKGGADATKLDLGDDAAAFSPLFYVFSVVTAVASTSYLTLKRAPAASVALAEQRLQELHQRQIQLQRQKELQDQRQAELDEARNSELQAHRTVVAARRRAGLTANSPSTGGKQHELRVNDSASDSEQFESKAESGVDDIGDTGQSVSDGPASLGVNTIRAKGINMTMTSLTPARSAAIQRLRSQYKLNDITHRDQPYFHLLKECHPFYFHGRTRGGTQICYFRPGTTSITRLKHHGVTAEAITQHYLFCFEYLWTVIERNNPRAQCFVLLDLAGLRYTDIVGSSLKALRAIITLMSSVYPNRCESIILFNVPWFFNSMWSSLGSVVAPKTRDKMLVLGQLNPDHNPADMSMLDAPSMDGQHARSNSGNRAFVDAGNLNSDDPEVVDKLLEFIPPEFLPEAYFHSDKCTGSADFGQSDEELSIRRHVESVLIETGTKPVGVDLSKYCLQELE